MHSRLLTNNHKKILLGAFAVMCLLTLFCIALVLKSDSFWNVSGYLSRIAYIICLLFLTPLAGYLIIKKETGIVFSKVLEHAGVYKCNEQGLEAFERFIATL